MKGFPKHLNSRADYEYIRKNFPREQWEPCWRALLAEGKNWFIAYKLESEAAGITDATHKVVKYEAQDEEHQDEFYQYEFHTDPASDMIRLGFTEEEILKVLEEEN